MSVEVSIIISTYNRAHLIIQTLESIQNQTYYNFECIIIDDGSRDNTQEKVRDFILCDLRFKYFKRTAKYAKGLSGSRNYGLDLAIGDKIVFFDDDDLVHPMCLEICHNVLLGSYDFCVYRKQSFEDANFKISSVQENAIIESSIGINNLIDILENKISMASCTVMWKKYCFTSDRFLEYLQYAEEWELYSRLITRGYRGVSIDNILYFNRKHAKSNTHEYFSRNPERRKSKSDAILAIAINLRDKNMLNFKLKKYLVNKSGRFKDFKLFQFLEQIFNSSLMEDAFFKVYYVTYPLRYQILRIRKIFS